MLLLSLGLLKRDNDINVYGFFLLFLVFSFNCFRARMNKNYLVSSI